MNDISPMITLTGGCRCGKLRYEATTSGLKSAVCACADCQRSSGSFLSVAVGIKEPLFKLTTGGEHLKRYTDIGESGQPVHRFFCGCCGSPLYAAAESYTGIISLRAVSLDEPFKERASFVIFKENIPAWVGLDDVPCLDD